MPKIFAKELRAGELSSACFICRTKSLVSTKVPELSRNSTNNKKVSALNILSYKLYSLFFQNKYLLPMFDPGGPFAPNKHWCTTIKRQLGHMGCLKMFCPKWSQWLSFSDLVFLNVLGILMDIGEFTHATLEQRNASSNLMKPQRRYCFSWLNLSYWNLSRMVHGHQVQRASLGKLP